MYKLVKRADLSDLIIIGVIVSHIGWVFETLMFYFMYGGIHDRGFISLPFCPIYGITIIAVYILIGTPRGGGIILGRLSPTGLRMVLYYLLASIIPATFEFVGGEVMEWASGEVLWSYEAYKYSFGKYACLEIALGWGIAIFLFMCIFEPLLSQIRKIPRRQSKILACVLFLAIALDFVITLCKSAI